MIAFYQSFELINLKEDQMKKPVFVFLCLLALVITSVPVTARSSDLACTMVLCLYGEKNGSGDNSGCESALSEYYKIKKTKKHSSKIKCRATKERRLAKLLTCKQDSYDVKQLVDCDG